jgi:bifunctional DNA-binding transcriptional regulator/antitoxin component of YhaV-PrlF toxin-antitoxin module
MKDTTPPQIPAQRGAAGHRVVLPSTFRGYVSVQNRGLIAIPPELRKRYGMDKPGSQVEIVEREDGVLELHPHVAVPASQAWFWTEQWQAREREADEDIANGRITTHETVDDLLGYLGGLDAEATAQEAAAAGPE